MDDKRKALYDALSGEYNLGSYEEFTEKLNDENKRKALYDAAGQDYNLGTYEEYSTKLGFEPNAIKEDNAAVDGSVPMFDDEPQAAPAAENVEENSRKLRGLWANFKESSKGLWAGLKGYAGEQLNMFSGSSREEQAALNDIEQLEQQGIDVTQYLADKEKAEFQEAYGMSKEEFMALDKKKRKELVDQATDRMVTQQPILDEARLKEQKRQLANQKSVEGAFRKALETAGGDMTKAKAILREQAADKTKGDVLIEEATETMNNLREPEGFAGWVGNLLPQMIPATATLALNYLTKGKASGLSKVIGFGTMGGLTLSTAGMSMIEARNAGATNLEVWLTGIADGAIEIISEKIPFDRVTKRVFSSAKANVAKKLGDAVLNPKGRAELEKLLSDANEKLGGRLFSKKNVDEWLKDTAYEAAGEFTAEALQTITTMIYENPEDYPTISEVLANGWEGAKAGLFMGAITGGASHAVAHSMNKDRRQAQGYVDVAQMENEDGDVEVVEVVGEDPQTGNITILHNDELESVSREKIGDRFRFSYEEFENARLREMEDEAIESGNVTDGQIQGLVENISKDIEEIKALAPEMTESEISAILQSEMAVEPDTPLGDAVAKYQEDVARHDELVAAKREADAAKKEAVRTEIETAVGQRFWVQESGEDDGSGIIPVSETVEEVVYADGRVGYVVGSDESGNLTMVYTDGTKGFSSRAEITDKMNSGEIVSDTPMGLEQYLEYKVSQNAVAAEQTRMAEEHALSVEEMIATHPQGSVINVGTEEAKIEVPVIAPPTKDGVIVQMPDGTTPMLTWEDVAHAEKKEITPKTDAQLNQSIVDEYRVAYTPAATAPSQTAQQKEEQVKRTSPANPLPLKADGSVDQTALWNKDPERWAQWNDEKRQDGGADSLAYVTNAIAVEQAKMAELQTARSQETDFDRRDALDAEIATAQERIDRLVAIQQGYLAQPAVADAVQNVQPEPQTEEEKAKAEDKRREPLRKRAKEFGEKLGVKVNIAESLTDVKEEQAREEILGAEVSGSGARFPGWYDRETGEVTIYLPHVKGVADIDRTIVHEVVAHKGLRGLLGKEGYNVLCDAVWDMMTEAERAKYMAYPGVDGDKRLAADEYIARFAEGLDLEQSRPIWNKIAEAVQKILNSMGIRLEVTKEDLADLIAASYMRLQEQARAAQTENAPVVEEVTEEIVPEATIEQQAETGADVEADIEEVTEESTSPIIAAAQQDKGGISFNVTTEDPLQDKIRKFAQTEEGKATGWTEDDIESIIAETESLIDAIHRSSTGNEFYDEFAYKEPTIRVDWRDGEAKPIVTWTRANIEYKYDMSADLLCINNEGLEKVLSSDKMVALMEMFVPEKKAKKGEPEIKFTSEDYLELYNTLKDLGFVVPCKGCFDAAGRFKMLPSVAQKFAAEVNAIIDERNKDPKAFDEKLKAKPGDKTVGGLPATAATKSAAIAAGVAGDNLTEHVKWTQLMSADGQTKMLSDWGGIFRAWQRTGAGRPKDKLLPEPYYGDIVSSVSTIIGKYGEKTPSFRDTLVNQGTGLRRNSHSEFRPVLAIDEIQFMRDAFIRNLTVFKYMKELDDVRLFGKMGVKFNMSFFPEYVPGTKVAGLDKDGNYIASEESVGSREFPYQGEDGKRHYDGMKGWEEAQKHINKDVSLSSVIFSIPHLLKALTDVPTPSDMRGIWGSLIPFHSSGATTASLAMQGLGMARANGVGHGFSEAFYDYGKGVTNFEAVQNDRFGEGWHIVSGTKAGTDVEPGHKLEFVNGNHYYNKALGVHLFASGYILDSELPAGVLGENGELDITNDQKKDLMHKFTIDYNDKVRELKGPYAYKDAADFYIAELPKLGLIPRFDFEVSEEKFLEMCEAANVDPRHPKLGWKGEGNSWSPIDSEAYYSLFCDYGMTDPATGEWAPHMPVGYVNEEGEREFRLPENAVEIVKDGLDRFSEVRRSENARIDEAIEAFAERSVEKGRISQKSVDKVLGKKSVPTKPAKPKKSGVIDLVEEAKKAVAREEVKKPNKGSLSFRMTTEMKEIKEKAQADGTFMKAPNGQPTNLTEEQWLMVRTQNFIKWFGDWLKPQRVEKLRQSESISLDGDEYVGKYELNKESAFNYILNELSGSYVNKDTGDEIKVSYKGAKKVTSHGYKDPIHLASIVHIPRMIQEAIFITEEPNLKRKNEFETYRYYVCGVNIDGEEYTAKIVVGVRNNETYYDHQLSSLEKGKLIDSRDLGTTRLAEDEFTLLDVKDKRLISILQNDFSKVVDENGEPKVVYHQTNQKIYVNRETGENWDELGWKEKMEWDNRDDWEDYWEEQDFNTFSRVNARTTNEFDGFFFAPEYDEYHEYGDRTIAAFVNIKNPASREDYNIDSRYNDAGRNERIRLQEAGFDGVIRMDGDNVDEYIAFEPNQIKSATDNNGDFNPKNNNISFRAVNENQAIFVSNAAKAVEGIKQEKATPEQWLKMIEKNGGLKAGEDKWMGLSYWLKASDKKTLTKQEVLDFINENMIVIEEQHYGEMDEETREFVTDNSIINMYGVSFRDSFNTAFVIEENFRGEWYVDVQDYEEAVSLYNEHNEDKITIDPADIEYESREETLLKEWATSVLKNAEQNDGVKPINTTRMNYTTEGLDNKHEIALTIPTIETWNEEDEIHFGDAGEGRAVAWIRFGEKVVNEEAETEYKRDRKNEQDYRAEMEQKYGSLASGMRSILTEKEYAYYMHLVNRTFHSNERRKEGGKRVLVIDEIQSKRHQEGREKGYRVSDIEQWLSDNNVEVVESGEFYEFIKNGETDRRFSKGLMNYDIEKAKRLYVSGYNKSDIPDAPFDKNWHELAMKRMLRYAAENGYDVIAWTKGEQQAERYGIGNAVSRIESGNAEGFSGTKKIVDIYAPNGVLSSTLYVNEDGKVVSGDYLGQSLSDIVGKEMAVKLMADGEVVIDGDNLRIGGEGMKGFYDRMLPAFMNKYGKKWGVKVEDIELPNLEDGLTMHSIPVTEEMKASVMGGQVMFRMRTEEEDAMEFTQQAINDCTSRYNEVAEVKVFPANEETAERFGYTMEEMQETGGTYLKDEDIIAIFALQDIKDSRIFENIFFHESIHKLAEFYPEFKKIGEWMWNNADVVGLQKIKDNVKKAYEQEWHHEEMLAYGIANAMSLGRVEQIESGIPEEYKGGFRQILNEIGYEPEKESRRDESRVSESIRRGAAAMERKTDESGRSKKEEARTGELTAEERRVIGEYFPEFNKSEEEVMKAPNGKDSKLTKDQWNLVRSEEFIGWFGDWINDPENASKVVDPETGEPMLVYHGTISSRFSEFNDEIRKNTKAPKGTYWFVDSKENAKTYASSEEGLYQCFLNLRNPAEIDVEGGAWYELPADYEVYDGNEIDEMFDTLEEAKAFARENGIDESTIEPRGVTDTNAFVQRIKDKGVNDGVIIRNVIDAGDMAEDYSAEPATEFIVFKPNQVSFRTSTDLDEEFGDAWRNQQNEDGRHSTQVANTKSTYEKIGRYLEDAGMKGASILDASSGLGLGTQALREMGFQVDDVEPFPSENREAPTFSSYADIDKQYDVVISNAVLNVIPDDWRADVLHQMADAVKEGGKMIINTRPASNIAQQGVEGKTRITLDSPSEILVKRGDRIAAYQKGFTSEELAEWIKSELGEGWRVEKATKKNSGISGEGTAVVIKGGDNVSFRVTGTPTDEVVANGVSLTPAQTAEVAANIFAALPEENRKKITDGLNGNILGLKDAILQIPASLATKENWNEEDRAMADVVAEEMTKMAGEMTRPFSAPEALWLLYNNLNKGNDLISQASRALVQRNLGFDEETLERQEEAKQGVSFRMVGDATANAKASMYNRGAVNVWTRLKESFVDMHASVEELVSAIEKATGKVAKGFENVLLALNQQPSKGFTAMETYEQKFLNEMFDEIRWIMDKTDFKYEDIVRYVILKHGLERNEKMAQRDAKAHYQEIYDDIIAKIKGMNPAQKRTYLTNAQLRDSDAKAELARLQGVNTSTLTPDQLRDHKKELAKAKKEASEAAEHLVKAQKVATLTEQDAQDELDKIFKKIERGTDSVYKEMRKNDYSGISSMFYDTLGVDRKNYATEEEYQSALMQAKADKYDNLGDIEGAAQMEVTLFENTIQTNNLWKSINKATKETLRQQYEANMISKDQYESLRDMFEYYVPLRGFKDNTAEDMYTYYRKPNSTGYTKPILGAEGRKTEAESPFGWIAAMAGSAIASNVKNEAKLALYYFVSNRPNNGIATLSRTWFVHTPGDMDANGKKIFKPAYPPFSEDLSSDAAKQAYEDWQEQMRDLQKQGLAYEAGQRLNLGNAVVNISDANKPEHVVTVKVAGKDYTIVINGNPRAAQAINGDLNIETNDTYNNVLLGPWLRWLSSVNTSYNPEFWATNMMRDVAFTIMAVSIKGDAAYQRKFFKNYRKAFKVVSMVVKNEKGTLGNSYIEQQYKDFVKYGGVTGYTQIKDSETWEKEIEKYLKNQDADTTKAIKAVKDGLHAFHRFGESLEQVSRFAAFLTAVETGKSINEAINDAKEITVNFNRKGSGKRITIEEAKLLTKNNGQRLNDVEAAIVSGISYLAPIARSTIMFFNASVQALNAWFKLWKANKHRSLSWAIGYAAIGVMNALIHALLDDDDEYLDIPQYERRSSLMLGGNGVYFKWALPQEMSVFYALGELSVEAILGRNPHQSFAAEATKVIGDVLPVNIAKIILEEGGWVEAMPSQIKAPLELLRNEDYKGDVIFNDQKWLSEGERERTANWKSAYKGTGRPYIEISRLLNNLTDNKDLDEAGWINIHPGSLEHVVESMTGGVGRTVSKLFNFISAAINPEEDVTVKQTPFLNRFLTINDERYKNVYVNDVYDYYAAESEHALNLQKQYTKDRDAEALKNLRDRDEYQWAKVYRKYKKALDNLKEKLKVAEGTAERKELMRQQDELKRRVIKEISEL